MPPKKRKYNEVYVKFGFTAITASDGEVNPQCFLCGKTFCNDYMKPTRMKGHLQADHASHASESEERFRQKKARFESNGKLTTDHGFAPTQKPALEASYRVAYRIAREKPHTIGENLVKPCALEMVQLKCGEQHHKAIKSILLSNDSIPLSNDFSNNVLTIWLKISYNR